MTSVKLDVEKIVIKKTGLEVGVTSPLHQSSASSYAESDPQQWAPPPPPHPYTPPTPLPWSVAAADRAVGGAGGRVQLAAPPTSEGPDNRDV